MKAHRPIGLALLVSTAIVGLAACGGGEAAPPRSPSQERVKTAESPEPRSVEEAQEQIARARADLETPSSKPSADVMVSEPPKAPSPHPEDVGPKGGTSLREERTGNGDACSSPCRAITSMRRAVEALCRMTGASDNRCVEAKRTLSESTTRIASCKCEAY